MKKLRMTRADLKYCEVFCCGYCNLVHTLGSDNAVGYNAGIYGWNWDCYEIADKDYNQVYITTGYRNTVGKAIPYEITARYENEAKEIRRHYINYVEYKRRMTDLTQRLAAELINMDKE